jgi:soluble lytic murein transglycosylase-like protein
MRNPLIAAMLVLTLGAGLARADARKFSAAAVPGAGIHKPGRIVIRNDSRSITAFHFFDDVSEALVTLRSTKTLAYRPYGAAIFDSNARLSTPVPAYLSAIFADAAKTHGVDPRLLAAVATRESAGNANAVSGAGARGIMQLMPATAAFLGVSDVFDPRQSVFGGARYLRTLLDLFHGDLDLSLAAYNAGPGAVQRYNGVPPYPETRAYVAAVRRSYEHSLRAGD